MMKNDADFRYEELLSLEGGRPHDLVVESCRAMSGDEVVQIVYRDIPPGAIEGAKQWLLRHRLIVHDLVVGQTRLEGVWRTVDITQQLVADRTTGSTGVTVVQRLAKGYYDTLYFPAARIVEVENQPGNSVSVPGVFSSDLFGNIVIVDFRYIDPNVADTLVRDNTVISYQDLVVGDGVRLDGVWWRLSASSRLEEDGTATITLRLGRMVFATMGEVRNAYGVTRQYYVYDVPKSRAQSMVDSWAEYLDSVRAHGSGRVVGVNEQRATAIVVLEHSIPNEVRGQSVVESETCYVSRSAVVDRNLDAPVNSPGFQQGRVVTVKSSLNEDGKWDSEVTVETVKRDVERSRAYRETLVAKDRSQVVANQTSPNVDLENPPGFVPGQIVERQSEHNENCTWDNLQRVIEAKNVPHAFRAVRHTLLDKVEEVRNLNEAAPPEFPTGPNVGRITTVSATKNEYGLYDVNSETREAKRVDELRKVHTETAYELVESSQSVNLSDSELPAFPPSVEDGKIKTVHVNKNEFGLNDLTNEVKQAKQVLEATVVSEETALETRSVVANVSVSSPTEVSYEPGKVIRHQVKKSDYPGLYDEEIAIKQAKTGPGGEGIEVRTMHSRDKFSAVDMEGRSNAPEKLEAVELGPDGTITTVRSNLNESGLWDVSEEKVTPRSVTEQWATVQRTASGVKVSHRDGHNITQDEWESEWKPGNPQEGVMYKVVRRMNEHGRYRVSADKVEVTEVTRPEDGPTTNIYTWTTPYGVYGRKEYYHVKKADITSRIGAAVMAFNSACAPYVLSTRIGYDADTDTYDIILEAHPDLGRVSGGATAEVFQRTYTVYERQYYTVVDESGLPVTYYRDIQYREGIIQSLSINNVIGFVLDQKNVHVSQIARGLFAGRYKTPVNEGRWSRVT